MIDFYFLYINIILTMTKKGTRDFSNQKLMWRNSLDQSRESSRWQEIKLVWSGDQCHHGTRQDWFGWESSANTFKWFHWDQKSLFSDTPTTCAVPFLNLYFFFINDAKGLRILTRRLQYEQMKKSIALPFTLNSPS